MTRVWGCPFWTPCGPGARGTRLRCNKKIWRHNPPRRTECTAGTQKIHSRSKAGEKLWIFLVSSECHRDLCTLAQGGIQGDCGVVDLGDVLDDGET